MNIILDLSIIVIIVLSVILGIRRGFVKSILHFFGGIASFVLAFIYTDRLASFIENKFVFGFLKSKVSDAITSISGQPIDKADVSALVADRQTDFMNFLDKYGVSGETAANNLSNSAGKSMADINDSFSSFVAEGLSHTVSYVIAFVLILIAAWIAIRLLIWLSDIIFKLPVLHLSNKALGVIFGALVGVLIAFVFAAAVNYLIPYLQSTDSAFVSSINADDTVLFKMFVSINPIMSVLGRLI